MPSNYRNANQTNMPLKGRMTYSPSRNNEVNTKERTVVTNTNHTSNDENPVLLDAAHVRAITNEYTPQLLRSLVNEGLQSSFITEESV